MDERIVFFMCTKKGGKLVKTFWKRADAEKHPEFQLCTIEAKVVDVEEARNTALNKMSELDKLVMAGWRYDR